jgi:hypothetical protein
MRPAPNSHCWSFVFAVVTALALWPAAASAVQLCPDPTTPIVVSFDERGFRFTDLEHGVSFDIDADGILEHLAWTDPSYDSALLVLDRNQNAIIDHGGELFGGVTPQPPAAAPNGFRALAVFDQPGEGGNQDGFITAADAVFADLQLWFDRNQDGRSQPEELEPLSARGLSAIDLDYQTRRRLDPHGNLLRWISWTNIGDRRRLSAVDVILLVE